jgi:hypothetical protein
MYYLAMLSDDLFRTVDAVLDSESPADALEMLAGEFRACGRYDLLFEARTMRKRVDLGLPLVQTEPSSSFPDEVRTVYDQAVIAAAREAGELYLAAGNIPSGWRYLRAIGELAPVAAAIENAQPDEDLDELIAIAFQEGVHPLKGLELILRNQGICRAITALGMQAVEKDREACIDLLIRELHSEAVERIRKTVEQQEGAAPQENCLPGLMQGRPWLFGEYDYYVDTSHLTSLLPYCLEVTKVETLQPENRPYVGRARDVDLSVRAIPSACEQCLERGKETASHSVGAVWAGRCRGFKKPWACAAKPHPASTTVKDR